MAEANHHNPKPQRGDMFIEPTESWWRLGNVELPKKCAPLKPQRGDMRCVALGFH